MKIDFSKTLGAVKPMHATNNGPFARANDIKTWTFHPWASNLLEFKNAGIPYARMHDSSFYHRYGQEHTVDVYYLFPNFDADPYNPDNYDFACTDKYFNCCELAGVEVFFRLGHRIEHEIKKYGTLPPKDFKKWAIICEHIIRHYTEGWANGFNMKITYWEIWNEPDLVNGDGTSPTWGGTKEQFFELYHVAATHLKSCFPHLKIGGPAIAGNFAWAEEFIAQLKAPLDFFSWHCYGNTTQKTLDRAKIAREILDKYGYTETESILNEWNYINAFNDEGFAYSHNLRGSIKESAFSLATMASCLYAPVDMLMYYDARPNEYWCGLFDYRFIGKVLKGYYSFSMFNTLYRMKCAVQTSVMEENMYACAAKSDDESAVIVTHFNDDDNAEPKKAEIDLVNIGGEKGTDIELFVLDETHDCESVGKVTCYGERLTLELNFPNFTSYLIKLKKIK